MSAHSMMTQQEFHRIEAMNQWLFGVPSAAARLDSEFVLWLEAMRARQRFYELRTLVDRRRRSGASLDPGSILEEIG